VETKKLVPYSVHLPEHLYNQIRSAAEQRKASSIIRDALEAYFKNHNSVESGRHQGVIECMRVIDNDPMLNRLWLDEVRLSDRINTKLTKLLPKENRRAKSKT